MTGNVGVPLLATYFLSTAVRVRQITFSEYLKLKRETCASMLRTTLFHSVNDLDGTSLYYCRRERYCETINPSAGARRDNIGDNIRI